MLEITKLLTISTAHVKESTMKLLDKEPNTDTLGLCVYNKADFGYYIMTDKNTLQRINTQPDFPEELKTLIILAVDLNCSTLCLDCDCDILPYLPTNDW